MDTQKTELTPDHALKSLVYEMSISQTQDSEAQKDDRQTDDHGGACIRVDVSQHTVRSRSHSRRRDTRAAGRRCRQGPSISVKGVGNNRSDMVRRARGGRGGDRSHGVRLRPPGRFEL